MMFNNKYEQIKIIEKRRFVTIYEVLDKTFNKFYALKFISNIDNIDNFKEEYEKQIEVLKNIKNKYIIEIKDNFYDEINKGYCIVMELCDEDLRKILNKYKPNGLPLNIINKIFIQLNDALKVMRDKNFIHSNLKPENILIKYTDNNKNNFDIKLTDFGLSNNEIISSFHTFSKSGSINYMAPEIETNNYNNKCDLWSLGVILYELYTNKYIFYSDNTKEQNDNRYEGKIVNETDNEMINKLIRKLIQVDINKRIEWEEYFNNEFFKNNKQIKILDLKLPLLKIIFSFLNENIILNIIINNKNLQKKLDINIENYKKISKRYKIGKINGYGKEYLKINGKLVFEGEYLNGKRNGIGKEYDNDYDNNLLFIGEYLNGKRNGRGEEYNSFGLLKFEGEYLNGKRWNGNGFNITNNEIDYEIKDGIGKVKEYYTNGKLEFEGEYVNGEINGMGKEYYRNGILKFEGEYLNGERNGKGKEYYKNGILKYEGDYLNGERYGKGKKY